MFENKMQNQPITMTKCPTMRDAIYGLAIGDAMGVPWEFTPRGSFCVTDMTGYGTYGQPAGTWSDDTALTLATCYSIKHRGCIDLADILNCFRNWLYKAQFTATGEVFDVGSTTRIAIGRGEGESDEQSNGNGSLMRIIPLAFVKDIKEQEIAAVSALTHAHRLSTDTCILYVNIARQLIQKVPLQLIYRNIALPSSDFEWIRSIDTWLESEIKSSGYVLDTLQASLWVLANSDSFYEAILKAVNLGDDTDTVGAVTGALAGIIYGYQSIPEIWMSQLQNRDLIEECLF